MTISGSPVATSRAVDIPPTVDIPEYPTTEFRLLNPGDQFATPHLPTGIQPTTNNTSHPIFTDCAPRHSTNSK
jgi:hypothetical protein